MKRLRCKIEAHRKNAHEQLYSLQVFMELNRTSTSESRDLVADMARAIEAPAPAAGSEPAAEGAEAAAVADEQPEFDLAAGDGEAKR